MILRALICLFVGFITTSDALAVNYRVTFTGTWSADDVAPGTYPSGAHFSDLIGTTHTENSEFWRMGEPSSPGVEQVAELGVNGVIEFELQALQQAGVAGDLILFQSLFGLPNSDTIEIEVSDDKPFISLVSMIAPSPDWFVGVSGLALQEAGTEEGNTFSLSNPESIAGVISRLSGDDSPFIGEPGVATLQFTLLNPPTVDPPEPTLPEDEVDSSLTAIFTLLLDD